ncbi:MAG: HD domain-containing protein [Fimbriimonas ginsengisoli]|uniref:HD domain-containing protein n=1 Tax=Fimbriimonas ginsengisoli TaxID=1005039 RepID=A0A931LZ06_FIMGI|nr:HD domain-containing protein [Fimbriimonas ginsengisoli]
MREALEAIRTATLGTAYEGKVWLVGGAVRDPLLGLPEPQDVDLVTLLPAPELAVSLAAKGLSSLPPVLYRRFGTALIRVAGTNVEMVTARRESYRADSRKPDVAPASLEEDARRRDFTVNTLLRNLHTDEPLDPLGRGLADLKARILRTPLDPLDTFKEDPLRMLRAVRFRWQLGLAYAPGLEEAIRAAGPRLEIVSAERIRDEFTRLLGLKSAADALGGLMALGLIDQFAPELRAMVGVDQGSFHHLDVWDHTRLVVRNAGPGDVTLALAALLHDVGKPSTRSVEADGRIRFFGHERVGAELAAGLLGRLRYSAREIDGVRVLIASHMRLGTMPKLTIAAVRRLVHDLGDHLDRLLALVEADAAGLKAGVRSVDLAEVRRLVAHVREEAARVPLRSPLTGSEIMAATGLAPGPAVGRLILMLTNSVLDGKLPAGDKEGALALLKAEANESHGKATGKP